MKNKGITLISLIVTIIVLLILAGITINLTIGNGSIFNNAQVAREENKKAQIKEYLDLKLLDEQSSNYFSTAEEIVGATRENVYKNQNDLKKIGNEVEVKEVVATENDAYFYVVVDKGVYKVSLEGTKYLGEQTDKDVELKEGDITFGYSPAGSTNKNVKVTISTIKDTSEYTLEYRKQNDVVWTKYTEEIEVSTNQEIYARLKSVVGVTTTATGNVNTIDKLEPNTPTIKVETTTNSITITAISTDQAKTNDYACSGIFGYSFSKNGGTDWTDYQESGTYIYDTDITAHTTYQIAVKVKDNAGNECITPATASATTLWPTVSTKLKVGDYVSYTPTSQEYTLAESDTGYATSQTFKTGDYTGLWRVLYNDSTNGLQLISDSSVINLTMNGTVGYNKFVDTLNTVASKYVNSTFASSGRSAGSNPTSPASASTKYTNSNFEYIATSASDMIIADSNYQTDFNAMNSAGMVNIGDDYWMASRYIYADENGAGFHGVVTDNTGNIISLALRCVHSYGDTSDHAYTKGVRAVVVLNNDVYATTGSGTSSSPYSLSVSGN
jgi:hypothetical protein